MVCELTGITRVETECQQGEAPQVIVTELKSRDNAINYLRRYERDWFFAVLDNWLRHKVVLYKNNANESLHLLAQSLHDTATGDLPTKKISTGAARILAAQDKFKLLVPHENNPSHKSSLTDLLELLSYCEIAKGYDY